jgi:hypothetical protein
VDYELKGKKWIRSVVRHPREGDTFVNVSNIIKDDKRAFAAKL